MPLNLATLLPPGTLIINDYCYADSFLGCIGRVDVRVAGSPPPSIGSSSINADSLSLNDVQGLVTSGLVSFLADPDGGGPADAPIAAALQTALAGIAIDGPIGAGIGVTLETPLFQVNEDTAGITLGSDTRMAILPACANPNAYNPTASYVVPGVTFPSGGSAYGATTPTTGLPAGALPYGIAIGISPTAFNQLLRTQIEGGLLLVNLNQLDLFGTGPVPITSTILRLFEPRSALLGPNVPLTLAIKPLLAPVITGAGGRPARSRSFAPDTSRSTSSARRASA